MQHIDKIDMNTRGIAKLVSAVECVKDDDKSTIAHQGRVIEVIDDLVFKLVQERRNLRAWLEDELKRKRGQQ